MPTICALRGADGFELLRGLGIEASDGFHNSYNLDLAFQFGLHVRHTSILHPKLRVDASPLAVANLLQKFTRPGRDLAGFPKLANEQLYHLSLCNHV